MREVPPTPLSLTDRLDHLIGMFSPRVAFERMAYRRAAKAMGAYRGAEKSSLRDDWRPGGGSADEDILESLEDLRERSRDLARNDGYGGGAINQLVLDVIGTGIRPQSRIDWERIGISEGAAETWQKLAENVWEDSLPWQDVTLRTDGYGLQDLVERQVLENGDVLLVTRIVEPDRWRPNGVAWEPIEADRLATPTGIDRAKHDIRGGVELGPNGEAVAYWVMKRHPGDMSVGRPAWSRSADAFMRIPARLPNGWPGVIHVYDLLRPEQSRGVPMLASVLDAFKDMNEYLEAELVAARLQACIGMIIKTQGQGGLPFGGTTEAATGASRKRKMKMSPGMVEYLLPGEEVQPFAPQRPGSPFEQFLKVGHRIKAAGTGVPHEIVTNDFGGMNYSSARVMLTRYMKLVRRRQSRRSLVVARMFAMVLEDAYLRGRFAAPNFYQNLSAWSRVRCIAPGSPWVDPEKEVNSAVTAVDNGLSTLADELASRGLDWEEVLEQRAREVRKAKALGLELGMGNRAAGAGAKQGEPQRHKDTKDDDDEPES